MNNNPDFEYCRQKAIPDGSSLYYATMYYPPELYKKICALHAYKNELLEIADCSDPGVALIKFAWWKEEIRKLADNEPRHPVTRELGNVLEIDKNTTIALLKLSDFYESRLTHEAFQSLENLKESFYSGTSNFWKLIADICGNYHPHTPESVAKLGYSHELLLQLQIPYLQKNLDRQIVHIGPGKNCSEKYPALLGLIQSELKEYLQTIPRRDIYNQLHIVILAEISLATCNEILNSGTEPGMETVYLTPLRKFWIAWRSYRKNKKFRY